MKILLDMVKKFYDMKYNPTESYVLIKGEKVYFNTETINNLYDLPNDEEILEHTLIT